MPSINDTIRGFQAVAPGVATGSSHARPGRLESLSAFGTNPGALDGWFHAPRGGDGMALVVVLHGCTQTAAWYDHGSGWSDLAERFGFVVLFPQQRRANNANLCFNWFLQGDTRRDAGEALSIRQMIDAVTTRHPIDPARVFVTGLSAGGAMAGVMLATYPEIFAGGGIIAGLPYGAATSVTTALERMAGRGHATPAVAAATVRDASRHQGPWPRITVWHGDADRTVDVRNADAVLAQWRGVHGAREVPDRTDVIDGQRHRGWFGQDGEIAVEEYRIAGMGHGTPLATRGAQGVGHAGAYMLEVGISSTWRQAQRWGLTTSPVAASSAPASAVPDAPVERRDAGTGTGVAGMIEYALRSAGLMR